MALTVGITCLSVYLLLADVGPRFAAAYTLFDVWQQQQATIASVEDWTMRQEQLDTRKRLLRQRFTDLYVNLPRSDQMSRLFQVLQESAGAVPVILQEVRPVERMTFAGYDELPFQLVLRGTFHEVGQFINQVEQSPYIMKVKQLRLQRTTTAAVTLRAEMLLSVIVLKEQ